MAPGFGAQALPIALAVAMVVALVRSADAQCTQVSEIACATSLASPKSLRWERLLVEEGSSRPLLVPPCGPVQVGLYEQCGGRSSLAGLNAPDPEFCCPEGSLCRFYDENFWQCQPHHNYQAPPAPMEVHDEQACGGRAKVGDRFAY